MRSGDDDFADDGSISGDGEGFRLTTLGIRGGVLSGPASSESYMSAATFGEVGGERINSSLQQTWNQGVGARLVPSLGANASPGLTRHQQSYGGALTISKYLRNQVHDRDVDMLQGTLSKRIARTVTKQAAGDISNRYRARKLQSSLDERHYTCSVARPTVSTEYPGSQSPPLGANELV